MTPPKCLLKRAQDYYYNISQNTTTNTNKTIMNNNSINLHWSRLQQIQTAINDENSNCQPVNFSKTPIVPEIPLDLSCKIDIETITNESENRTNFQFNQFTKSDFLHRFNRFINQQNQYHHHHHHNNNALPILNMENFRHKLANLFRPSLIANDSNSNDNSNSSSSNISPIPVINNHNSDNSTPNFIRNHGPGIFISSPSSTSFPDNITNNNQNSSNIDLNLLTADRFPHNRNHRHSSSPESINSNSESLVDNSSDASSLCTTSSHRRRRHFPRTNSDVNSRQNNSPTKRKLDGRVIRPFKLYKNNDSKSVFEALNITEEDENWLKNVVEHKNVDDIFQFLTDVMNNSNNATTDGFSEEILEKIKEKFGYIFVNCNTSVSNPRMIRHPDMTPKELKTEEYWEKRRKNNEAAKRSREARRNKEEGLTKRCDELQRENDEIRREIERIRIQIDDVKRNIG